MPATSRRERIARLRRALLSRDRWVNALLVVEDHTGAEVFRVGGCWDRELRAYVDRPCAEHRVRLQESQLELARAFARWMEKCRADERRPRAIMGGGDRGSGKTWFLAGVGFVAMALAFPGDWQFGINITSKQKRECLEAIREVALPGWIESDISDFRDPRTRFVTGNTIAWKSSQAPRAIREAGLNLRYILVNEGQDQPVSVATNAIAAIRNTGGLVGVATNPPQVERSDWVANWWVDIEAGKLNGEKYLVEARLNRAIDQEARKDIGPFLLSADPGSYEADALGVFKLTGNVAYPGFSPLPLERGGHVGDPPAQIVNIDGTRQGWSDVTAEITAAIIDSSVGFPYVIGVDFQKHPGVVGQLAKLYRNDQGELVLHVIRTIAVRGVEADFSQALHAAGYVPDPGKPASVMIVADATGARQNAEHRWNEPTSFKALKADGWYVQPAGRHWRTKVPWNPLVTESRDQMHSLFLRKRILLSPRCEEPTEGFHSLVESFRKAKAGPKGGLVEKGGYQHCPDGVRYLAWRFLPRPQGPAPAPIDTETADAVRKIRFLTSA